MPALLFYIDLLCFCKLDLLQRDLGRRQVVWTLRNWRRKDGPPGRLLRPNLTSVCSKLEVKH